MSKKPDGSVRSSQVITTCLTRGGSRKTARAAPASTRGAPGEEPDELQPGGIGQGLEQPGEQVVALCPGVADRHEAAFSGLQA